MPIIAPTAEICDMVARGQGIRRDEIVYVRDISQLQGIRPDVEVLCYRPWRGPEWSFLQADAAAYAVARGMKLRYVPEADLVP